MGALPAHRQATAVPQPAVAAEVHQPLDVELHLAPEVALHQVIAVDHLADVQHFLVGELRDPALARDPDLLHDFPGFGRADSMDVLQRDNNALVGGNVDASNTGQSRLSFSGRGAGRVCASAEMTARGYSAVSSRRLQSTRPEPESRLRAHPIPGQPETLKTTPAPPLRAARRRFSTNLELCRLLGDSNRFRQPLEAPFPPVRIRSIAAPTSPTGAMPSTVRNAPFFP